MTPSLKFATAATVAFALGIGASMLVLPQSSGPVSAPAASEPSPVASPVPDDAAFFVPPALKEFTARRRYEKDARYDPTVTSTGLRQEWSVVEASDPRFDGAVIGTMVYQGVVGWPSAHGSFELENDEGTWIGEPFITLEFPDGTGSTGTVRFIGGGRYEGYTAVVEIAYDPAQVAMDLRGVITMGPVSDPPEITRTE